MIDLIYPMTFVAINSDAFVEHGVERGDIVFVAGHQVVPVSEEDPYTQRVKMIVNRLDDKDFIVQEGMYLMDPSSLINISIQEGLRLTEINDHVFEEKED